MQQLDLYGQQQDDAVVDAAAILAAAGASPYSPADVSDTTSPARADETLETLYNPDGSSPLEHVGHELFLRTGLAGLPWPLAYLKHISGRCSSKTAGEQASRLRRRPEVAARLRFLLAQGQSEKKEARKQVAAPAPMTEDEQLAALSGIWRDELKPFGERFAALRIIRDITGKRVPGEDKDPCPAYLCEYLRKADEQGRDIVREVEDIEQATRDILAGRQGQDGAISADSGGVE